ncbi:MAG: hypothetical protein JNL09_00525 [Anaerolineales bacterium]|nr:hypothetical protein [Anaerolineales bacterium]
MSVVFQWLPVIALLGVLLTAIILTLTVEWRVTFAALGLQYIFAALLLTQAVVWQVAAVEAVVGILVVIILTLTGRQINFGRMASSPAVQLPGQLARLVGPIEFQTNVPFRLIAILLAAVLVWFTVVVGNYVLPGLPLPLNLAGVWLIFLGLFGLGFTDEPMNAGAALLTTITGFEIIYAPLEPSLLVVASLAVVNFAIALAVSYLALLRVAERELAE